MRAIIEVMVTSVPLKVDSVFTRNWTSSPEFGFVRNVLPLDAKQRLGGRNLEK